MPDGDGRDARMDDAARDIDTLQQSISDGFSSMREAIGELRGEMRAGQRAMADAMAAEQASRKSDYSDVLARLNASLQPLVSRDAVETRFAPLESGQSELFRRINTMEPVVATHSSQIAGLQSGVSNAEAVRQARLTQAYGRRWQWVAWVIAAVATLADLVRAIPHLFSHGATP